MLVAREDLDVVVSCIATWGKRGNSHFRASSSSVDFGDSPKL